MKNSLSPKSTNSLVRLLDSSSVHEAAKNSLQGGLFPCQISGLRGSLPSFFLGQFASVKKIERMHKAQYENSPVQNQCDFVAVVSSRKEADECETDLSVALGDSAEIYKFPWWGTIPYRSVSKGAAVFGERAGILAKLSVRNSRTEKMRVFIVPLRSLLSPVPPLKYTRNLATVLRKGQEIDPEKLAERLSSQGYVRVPKIGMKGEFVLRGEVLEIFMAGENAAHRIVFDFDTISQIKIFEPDTQLSLGSVEKVVICPRKEVVWTESLVEKLDEIFREEDENGIKNDFASYDSAKKSCGIAENERSEVSGIPGENKNERSEAQRTERTNVHLALTENAKKEKDRIISELMEFGETEGEELFYPLIFGEKNCVLDYLPDDAEIFFYDWDKLLNARKMLLNEYSVSYRQKRQELPVFLPQAMLLDFFSVASECKKIVAFRTLETLENSAENDDENFSGFFKNSLCVKSENSQSYFGNISYLKEQLSLFQRDGYRIFIFADNENQSARIGEILKEFVQESGGSFPVEILPRSVTSGFSMAEEKILVIQENEIFGRKKNAPRSIRSAKSKAIDAFVDLTPGDFVVHANYGIGLFKGIERVKTSGNERDYIKLEYADEEIAFVPIEQVNLVQRYIGSETEKPRLDRIGSKSWRDRKAKVKQKVEEIAEKLIDLYSKRQSSGGFPFPKDTEWNAAFEAAFPYEDTPDQFTATREIKEDMEKPVPMDRLVCGDVGYGKTEIAMRAAFKAVMGGKQVAFLAPTTILAEQHYENCIERFKNFPVQIAQLSRFVSASEQKKILKNLLSGAVDIIIGTHRILQKDVLFKDLGLLIIDEEQRFGVKDKEKLKAMKTNVDCLALSATPIPRTLHMSLLKIRDMSLLTTPPQNRQSVETAIEEFSGEKVARAIRNEVNRGGQVFYLHNRVETLEETRRKIENLVPEMLVETAHGQMTSEELDDIFRRFKMGGFHVLVATTIIENGIDIPNVNTIIIDRADMYGVSQLYQLRGRVGRSDRKAYAFLFYPENKSLSEVAMKRLQVISDFTELGSGFKIAMKDMEIRGAGNLLGKDQSGEVYAVGFEMYLHLLNEAIQRLSSGDWKAQTEVLLELEYSGFIPDGYISQPETKMEMYKKIAAVQNQAELDSVWAELSDRFGTVPDEVSSLLSLAKIRIVCNQLSISSLKEKKGLVRAEFADVAKISTDKILRLVKSGGGRVSLDSSAPNVLILKTLSIDLKSKCDFIKEKLETLL